MSGLVEELKRRNIFRVATVYAIASWVILQLADITFPALDLPESDIRYVIITLMIGFPLVIGFAWLFEITPDGLRRSGQITPTESITVQTGRRIDFIIIGLLSVALLFFMSEYFSSPESELTPEISESSDVDLDVLAKPTIAVLPLVNMSSDEENEHFADGLTEELLNVLARNDQLQVAGRTSSFFYKGKNINLTQIGQELGVENILEGSVRKSGNMIRVTAQLINAETGYHLWSDTFDREITDIFAIQDEIARQVGEAMNLTLLTNFQSLPGAITENSAAYEAYLKGKSLLYDRRRVSVEAAMEAFREASQLDSGYGPPLVSLAEAYLVAENNFRTFTLSEAIDGAKEALDRAEAIGYLSSEYWATLGLLHHSVSHRELESVAIAEDAYRRAIDINDDNISAYIWFATHLTERTLRTQEVDSVDRQAQAVELLQSALKLDPKNRVASVNLQINLADLGRHDEAFANLERLVLQDPEYNGYKRFLARMFFMSGDFAKATEVLTQIDPLGAPETNQAFQMVEALDTWDWIDRLFAQVDDDNPLYDQLHETYAAFNATPAELVAKAQIALLQQDIDGWSGSVVGFLYQKGEFEWSKRLQEHNRPELKNENPRFALADNNRAFYVSTLFLAGYTERARTLAESGLMNNRGRIRIAPRGKWLSDAAYYMVLGRREEAIIEIESAYTDGFRLYYSSISDDPIYGPIIGDPRMVALKEKTDQHIATHITAVERNLVLAGLLAPLPDPQTL